MNVNLRLAALLLGMAPLTVTCAGAGRGRPGGPAPDVTTPVAPLPAGQTEPSMGFVARPTVQPAVLARKSHGPVALTVIVREMHPSLTISLRSLPFAPSGMAGASGPPAPGDVHEVIDASAHGSRSRKLSLPRSAGQIAFAATEKSRPKERWAYVINDYECDPRGHLTIVLQVKPQGDRWISLDAKYSGQGCRAPLTAECCEDHPNLPGWE